MEKRDDDWVGEDYLPFQGLEKSAVLQERIAFNETPIEPRKCCHLLTKYLYLLAQGETFTAQEATDVFFAVTKLFQSQDVVLRRMTYLVLKELAPIAKDVIIITSSLTKDMNSRTDVYRANSIRVLCQILTEVTMVGRYLKQAIVDKDPYVSASALVSGYHLMTMNPSNAEIVKRWFSEIQDAAKSKYTMVQYHALGLLYKIRKHDRLAVSKLVSHMTKSTVRSPYAHCLLIRLATQVLEQNFDRTLYGYLESCLRHKSEMVELEAARAICNMKDVSPSDLVPAVSVLQHFLNSMRPAYKFAAIRTLNKLAMTHQLSVTSCNIDMEALITDPNVSIATLAITTLLRTGSESSVDRLMSQISGFMNEIADDFKVVVVNAIRSLCIKYPKKQKTLLNFLSNSLRDEGGIEYKKGIVFAILDIIESIPTAREVGLSHLCEFIEDCEYTQLSTRILSVLGEQGPSTSCPSKFIRYIYNRVILENANVRASAVNALAKFGRKIEELRPSVLVLLRRCVHDSDDEVRDRAIFHLNLLENKDAPTLTLIDAVPDVPLANLEASLKQYLESPSDVAFDINSVPKQVKETPLEREKNLKAAAKEKNSFSSDYATELAKVAQLSGLGTLFSSSKPVELTESETEYTVNCVKHMFAEHIVLQFNCTNTLNDQLLENVVVKIESDEFEVEQEVPLPKLTDNGSGVTYSVLTRPEGELLTGSCCCTLKFIVKDVDPSTGDVDDQGYEDEYQIEDVDINTSDYMKKRLAPKFAEEWESLGDDNEVVDTYALTTMTSLQQAVDEIIDYLGMQACDQSNKVPPKRSKHILYLAGNSLEGVPALVRCRMKFAEGSGVSLELTVRSQDEQVTELIANTL